jgi:hypothetical protein
VVVGECVGATVGTAVGCSVHALQWAGQVICIDRLAHPMR